MNCWDGRFVCEDQFDFEILNHQTHFKNGIKEVIAFIGREFIHSPGHQ